MPTIEDKLKELDEKFKHSHFVHYSEIKSFLRSAVEEAFESTRVKEFTFENIDWGEGVTSTEPVEDKTKSLGYAQGYNQALAEVKKLQSNYLGKGK